MTDWMQPNGAKTNVTTNVNTNVSMAEVPVTRELPSGSGGVAEVKDISTRDFGKDVIEASGSGPVVVDFWAPWCEPCKQLGPVIEKIVADTKGAVRLVKMYIEKHPEIAQQMGIQSIPAVVAFVDGKPADAFMGVKPEPEMRAFIEKLAANSPIKGSEGPDIDAALAEAKKEMQAGDSAQAAEIYSAVLSHEPGNLDALTGLGKCLLAVGEIDQARALIEQVPENHHGEEPLSALVKALELADKAAELGDTSELAAKVEAEPANHQARSDYAIALNATGDRDGAAEQLIEIVRRDRKWNDDGAKTQLLELFETWGNMDPATSAARRGLSSVLFS